ncbi:MAG: aminopeptidase [Bacteroidetes bacterium]|nr:aminopeptidase [Bacteroidota bacterium]
MILKSSPVISLLIALSVLSSKSIFGQIEKDSTNEKYSFTKRIELPSSPVKDQASSGTCWSYASCSFLESEILRMTHDTLDISEMYFVRMNYAEKAKRFVRLHGTSNFGEGGQAHDVMDVVANSGLLLNSDYTGLANGQEKPDHAEMEAVLEAIVRTIVKNPSGKLSPNWMKTIEAVLDVYLGPKPVTTAYKGQSLTPVQLRDKLGIVPDNYIELTSYTQQPFYSSFMLEIPDNWRMASYYNVPLDELIQVMDNSLEKGFTIEWDGDVSDRGFSFKNQLAIVPDITLKNATAEEQQKWGKLTEKERKKQFFSFENVVPEKLVTQEIRQAAFDNYSATDDHLMHITGTGTDQSGKRYFLTKNSWSAESNDYGGFMYLSDSYVRMNTIAILVNKDSLPKDIRKKLNLE